MDAEMREYFDDILMAMNEGFSRLERRMAAAGSEPDIRELHDRLLSLEERHRTMQLRVDRLERRTSDQVTDRTLR